MAIAPNTDDQVGQILQALREAAPKLTESVIEAVFWRGVIDTTICAVGIAAALFFAFHGLKWGRKLLAGDDWASPVPMFAAAGCWLFATILGVSSAIGVGDALLKVISPEGVAIGRLLRMYL